MKAVVLLVSTFVALTCAHTAVPKEKSGTADTKLARRDHRRFYYESVQKLRDASRSKLQLSRTEHNNLRQQDVMAPWPTPLKHADKYWTFLSTANGDCSGDPHQGMSFPLNVCKGWLEYMGSYMIKVGSSIVINCTRCVGCHKTLY
jgi:hypothetical protein